MSEVAVAVDDLVVEFSSDEGPVRAVDRVNLQLERGKILGLIGESGCGKTTVAHAMLNAVAEPGRIVRGRIHYAGHGDLLGMSEEAQRLFRWQHVSVVFQASQNTLNPLQRIEAQIRELARAHRISNPNALVGRAREICDRLRLDGRRMLDAYPHQLSGGMRQRVGIMLALLLQPEIILFDEPTTALDSLSQESVLRIIEEIHAKEGISGVFITHDLGIVAEVADVVAVMYAGRIVETAPTGTLFNAPRHPYSRALLNALPRLTGDPRAAKGLIGAPPKVVGEVAGCLFRERCRFQTAQCKMAEPVLTSVDADHRVACFKINEEDGRASV